MKAQENSFLSFLEGKKQFIIPVYQRPYSWRTDSCAQLWEDIIQITAHQEQQSHFMGSILYTYYGLYSPGRAMKLEIVDGQQRIVTLSLLLAAIANALNDLPNSAHLTKEDIYSNYLINPYAKDTEHYKMHLTQDDQNTFIKILEQPEHAFSLQKKGNHLIENYSFFIDKIYKSNIDINDLYGSLRKLVLVEITLDEKSDDRLRIFESINVTGLRLTQADLIRKDVFEGLNTKEQEQFYKSHWHPLEQTLSLKEKPDLFYQFMCDYLEERLGKAPAIEDLSASFRAYHNSRLELPMKEIVEDMLDKSVYFAKAAVFYTKNPQIRAILKEVERLQIKRAQVFLAEVHRDHLQKHLSQAALITILKMVESYIFRCLICGINPSKIEKIFTDIEDEINKNDYIISLSDLMSTKISPEIWLKDTIFREKFVSRDIYHLPAHLRSYLFRKLECYGRKEYVVVENYTVEHIMPQNPLLSSKWQQELGSEWKEVHDKYLHTIGNLTLTGYNSELSDHPFLEKRDMVGGFAESPLRLNRNLARLKRWDKEQIEKRAYELADLALQIWAFPD